jgi:serine/threonine protein kinase
VKAVLRDLDAAQAQHISQLLDEALELEPEERAAWLEALGQRDTEPVELLRSLLSGLPELGGAVSESGERLADGLARILSRQPVAASGRSYGPYRALRLLGEGGMGSVWLAERADGLFTRRVALKLPRADILGGALHERFARERNILAGLAHPLIARLLDAGVTQDGQPYLALEYVEGTSLITHCDERRLSLPERIALLMQVIAAVQYAHQNLVIHRDLKPNNIMVTREGTVKLLDFGIAKLLPEEHAHETELTRRAGRALTPEYASPEQLAGQPVGTASDVYSLGVIMYVLLCGQRPYRPRRESPAALEESILSETPLRPSQQVSSAEIAAIRGTTPK